MKNIQKSLCSVAVVLGLTITSQAWAAEEPTLFNDAGTTPSLSSPSSTPLISDAPAPAVSAPAPTVTQVAPVVAKAPEVAKTQEVKKEEKDYSSTAQGNVLRKVAYLQSEFALKKIEKDISDLDGKKDSENGQVNGQMPVNQQAYPSGNLPPLPRAASGVPQVVVPEEPVMQATAVYSLGNQSYAEIVVNGNKFVAKQGMKLPNGYKVSSMNELGVTLVKGKKKAVLPVSSANIESESVQAPVAPIPAGFRQ